MFSSFRKYIMDDNLWFSLNFSVKVVQKVYTREYSEDLLGKWLETIKIKIPEGTGEKGNPLCL